MRPITFTVWKNVRDAKHEGEQDTRQWVDWLPDLTTHAERGPPPDPSDPIKSKSMLDRLKGGRCFVPGEVSGARNANGVKAIHAAMLDFDSVEPDKLLAAFEALSSYEAAVYTTHKHGFLGATRLRVVMPLLEPVPTAQYRIFWIGLNTLVGGINDKSTKSPQLPYYFPSTWKGSEVAEAWRQQGRWLNPEELTKLAGSAISTPEQLGDPLVSGSFAMSRACGVLRRMPRTHDLRDAATALLRGEPFADPGERHDIMVRLTGWLAFKTASQPLAAEVIAELFAQSLAMMMSEDPSLNEDPVGAYMEGVRKAKEFREEEERAVKQVQRPEGTTEYSEQELSSIARAQGCSEDQLMRRWIVQKGSTYYFLTATGGYAGPYSKDEALCAAHQELGRSPVRLIDWTEKGPKDRSMVALVKEHGRVAKTLVADFTLQRSVFDYSMGIMREAVCPLRLHEPRYDEQIEEWLTLMAGAQTPKLLDWMACAADLSKLLCALYFCGSKSSGKTLFAHGVASLWTNGAPTNASEVFGSDFNESILTCPLIFADETLPKNYKGMNVTELLRGLLSTSNRKIRRKYLSTGDAAGTLRVILAANNEYLLSAPSMTPDDIDAVAEKVLFIDSPGDKSREYLEELRRNDGEKLNRWRAGGIASFCLWLQENRNVLPESRFWVTGDMSQMLRNLLTTTGWNSRVCEFLARFLDEPKNLTSGGRGLVRIYEGELLVNTRGVIDGWITYMPEPRFEMETHKISGALRSISKGTTRKRWNGKPMDYHVIDVDNVIAWAERHQIGEATNMRGHLLSAVSSDDGELREAMNRPMGKAASNV